VADDGKGAPPVDFVHKLHVQQLGGKGMDFCTILKSIETRTE
jgi:hypothetical protein